MDVGDQCINLMHPVLVTAYPSLAYCDIRNFSLHWISDVISYIFG